MARSYAFLVALIGVVWPATVGQAQTSQPRTTETGVVGIVRDTADRILAQVDVTVTALDTSKAFDRHVRTDESGVFRLTGLAPSRYEVRLARIGFARLVDTVDVTAGQLDTVGFRMRQIPNFFDRVRDPALRADSTQPSVHMTYSDGGNRCGPPVDSVYVSRRDLVITGYHSSPTTANSFEPRVYRSGEGLVLDLQELFVAEVGMAVTCSRWRAEVTGLRTASYIVSVRWVDDPSVGAAHARVLWAGGVHLRRPTRFAVDPSATLR